LHGGEIGFECLQAGEEAGRKAKSTSATERTCMGEESEAAFAYLKRQIFRSAKLVPIHRLKPLDLRAHRLHVGLQCLYLQRFEKMQKRGRGEESASFQLVVVRFDKR
jgi:hypothetical protein